ncbi:hypothetical protein [Sphingobacterium sp. SYP-B4668]|uniref:hypothetical protein n=1 Tax=Sphingobacterium sp. SYP-B4668 TaxID=2996035 RepID=UPI0005327644|nr:hypothetical protein [Sphingobacterium sp. SYP-B4668]
MSLVRILLGVGAIALTISCGNSSNQKKEKGKNSGPTLHEVVDSLDAKKHFYFTITEDGKTDSSVFYLARGLYKSDTVGVKLEVLGDINPGINADGTPNEDNGFRKGAIKISSIGAESDAFVKVVGQVFNMPTNKPMVTTPILPTVFSSNKGKVDLTKNSTYSFKLFFDTPDNQQAEVFSVLDMYKNSFEITEKDSTFRTQFLKALTGE